MSQVPDIRIYTDGSCEFCLWARRLVEPHDREGRLDFLDFNRPEIAAEAPYSPAELSRRMHVRTPDGSWHAGYFGWIAVFEALPRYRWLARVLRWIPFRWVGPYIYDFVARNRYRIPRIVLRMLGAPRPCDESCALPAGDRQLSVKP